MLAHSGVLSLLPDHVIVHPGFVEDTTPVNEQQVALAVQQDVNLRRGADLLVARKDVDPKRIAYVGHSCDATAGGLLSGIDKRFQAFVIMAGDLSIEVDKSMKGFQEFRQKVGPEKLDAFMTKFAWMDAGKICLPCRTGRTVFAVRDRRAIFECGSSEALFPDRQRTQEAQDL